ncbi:MAG: hypothetical protein OXC44_07890 [Proteobacteria bacterium]|nr:hypothetical protein [Pseudomonadota bacterium]
MSGLDEDVLFYANLEGFLNQDYDPSLADTCTGYFKEPDFSKYVSHFRESRGRLQSVLGGLYLHESEWGKMRALAQKMDSIENQDQQVENEMSLHERDSLRRRRIRQGVIYGTILFLCVVIGGLFLPEKKVNFDPTSVLTYETEMIEARPNERLDLLTTARSDVKEYFLNHPKLSWDVDFLAMPESHWSLQGASALDYDAVVISLVVYSRLLGGKDIVEREQEVVSKDGLETRIEVVREYVNRKDVLAHYSFESDNNYLPSSEPEKYKSIEYFPFETDTYNIVLWRKHNRYNLIFGRIKPLEMVKYIP